MPSISLPFACLLSLLVFVQDPVLGGLATMDGAVLRQGTDQPIQGVAISLTPLGSRTLLGSPRSVRATTDEGGKFRITGITPGSYEIQADRTGFVQTSRTQSPRIFTVAAGEHLADIRILLEPTSVITGRVVDENSNPIVSVLVKALTVEYRGGSRMLLPCTATSVRTNGDGEYRLYGLAPGEYYVTVALTDDVCTTFFYPNVIDAAETIPLTVHGGATVEGIELRSPHLETYSLSFKVVGPPPISGPFQLQKRVQIVRRSRNGLLTTERPRNRLMELPESVYKILDLSPGSYELFLDYSGIATQIGHITFDVVDRDVDAGTMVIQRNVAVGGQIRSAATLPAGWSLDRARIILTPLDARDLLLTTTLGIMNNAAVDGTFLLAFLPSRGSSERPGTIPQGLYQVSVDGLVEDQYLAAALYGGRNVLDGGLLIDGDPPGPLELMLETGGSVVGTVRNTKDEVVPNAQVAFIPTQHRDDLNLYKTATADQYGRFSVRGVTPGDYVTLAGEDVEPGAWLNAEFRERFEQQGTKVTVTAGTVTTFAVRIRNQN